MADEDRRPPSAQAKESLGDVVTDATVKALQEFDSGEMEQNGTTKEEQPASSRPTSAKPSSRPTSAKPGSKAGSRPSSAKPPSRPASGRPASAKADRPPSATGSTKGERPPSATGSIKGDRPPSATGSVKEGKPASRPGSAASRGSKKGSKPPSPTEEPVEEKAPTPTNEVPPDGGEGGDGGDGGDGEPPQEPPQPPPQDISNILNRPVTEPDGGDGGGGGDSDDEEEEIDDGEGEESDAGSEAETDMVVLDPDHPLMKRFQNALKAHLTKQDEKVTLELRELIEALRNRKKEREDLGVELYGIQQELARFQMMLEKNHDEFANLNQARNQEEQQLDDVRGLYKDTQLNVNKEKKKCAELQSEVENLALRHFYMQNAKEDVRSDIAIMRRAAEKADTEVSKAEIEKQRQDLFVDRLVERVDKLKEEIAMFEAQIAAQTEETKAAKEALLEAHMEIEAIQLEKKQLFQQWNSSLIGMRRRDEAHAAMQEALNTQEQKVLSLETEIEGYKKSIFKEQEQNEKLTLILNKTERDIETVKKQLTQCQAKHDALKAEYATYTRMLHETEQALNRAVTDKTLRLNELNALRKQIEREYLEKVELEDEIMEKMRSQLTMDKAAQYTKKLTGKKRELTKQLETQMAEVENQISRDSLEISNVQTRIERLGKILGQLDDEIGGKNEVISKSEGEIVKRNAIIERKQNIIDQYNKKLEVLISKAGGVELGPLEIQINSLQKSIEARQQEIAELQQMWLRQQSELVQLSKDKDAQSSDVQKLKKQLTILSQKKIRTEGDIDEQRRETYDIERSIRNMQNDMIKLNTLLNKEKGTHECLHQDNILLENDFIMALKEAEKESIQMQANLDNIKEEKERLLNSLVEAERQIMLWEKKTQLARETRAAVDSEVGQGEIKAMKAEIHRMQVRFTQLMKQQEKMIQEMEKAVSRRDTIVTRGDASQKINKKVLTKGTFERQMGELRKKIKATINEAGSCDGEILDLRSHQGDLSSQLEQRQVNVQQLQSTSDTMDGDIERLYEIKQKNLTELLGKQQKSKYFQQAKDGKYVMLCKSESSLENEHTKQVDRMQALSAIVDRLNQEFPHIQPALRKVTLALSTRGDPILNALSKFQKSPNTFIPVHMHLRPRTRSQLTIWGLPEEVILFILRGLHIKDILNMRAVHPFFRDLIDGSPGVWSLASFKDTWPSANNIAHYDKAGEFGNLEALIKMAIAFLYNEGLPNDFDGKNVTSNGVKAAEMFCRIESMTVATDPFTWLFIRPPWSNSGACCKECVFTYMKNYLNENEEKEADCRNICVCVAKTLNVLDEDDSQGEAGLYLSKAANHKSGIAAFMMWQKKYHSCINDRAGRLESIRQLRDIANMGHLDAKLTLCESYSRHVYGGITGQKAAMYVRDFVQSTTPTNTQECFQTSQELTASMRYILVDWLVEVAGMKDFSSHTLHVAVSVVDRYLKIHKTSRSQLQLLGVAAMVLCSRYLGKDIITIREAAWLTDNTYKYEDVVRMMGEITATLKGKIRVVTSLDFVQIFSMLANLDKKCKCLAEYICELSLLQAEMGQYSPAEIAASCVLLAKLLMKLENPWSHQMVQFTGYTIEDISRCAFHMHEKCFLEGSVVDHRDVTLQAVKLRYSEEKLYKVSEMSIMSYEELCAMLGVTEHILQGTDVRVKFKNSDELILSPSRKKRRCIERNMPDLQERESAATPTMEDSMILNESVMSGYYGDREDEDESFYEFDESSEASGHSEMEQMGSESDTYFASISSGSKSLPKTMTLNLSFSGICNISPVKPKSTINCDTECSSSGVSLSPSSATMSDSPRPSSSSGHPILPNSPLGISGHSSHIWRRSSARMGKIVSDSDCDSPRSAEKQGSTSYMTLRRTTKRKSRRALCTSTTQS